MKFKFSSLQNMNFIVIGFILMWKCASGLLLFMSENFSIRSTKFYLLFAL